MSKDIECPYCGADQEINHDDGYGYAEDTHHTQQCGKCHKEFVYFTTIILSYEGHKADCLNGDEHKWAPTHTIPKCCTDMECDQCGERRPPTDEEKNKYNIPPFPELEEESGPF